MSDGTAPGDRRSLALSRRAYERVVARAREGAPEEVCGVLGGPGTEDGDGDDPADTDGGTDGGRRRVDAALPVENVADDPRTRYELDPAEQLRRIEAIEGDGGAVVGFYHSHPRGPAGPSGTDRALATWPGKSYVIVSLAGDEPAVGSWRWTGEKFEPERVAVEE